MLFYSVAYHFRSLYDSTLFELMQEIEQKSIFHIRQQYDYETLQSLATRQILKRQRAIIWISIVASVALSVLTLLMFRLAKMRKHEAVINANLFQFMQQNKELIRHKVDNDKMVLEQAEQLSNLLSSKLNTMQKFDYYLKSKGDKSFLNDIEKELFHDKIGRAHV